MSPAAFLVRASAQRTNVRFASTPPLQHTFWHVGGPSLLRPCWIAFLNSLLSSRFVWVLEHIGHSETD